MGWLLRTKRFIDHEALSFEASRNSPGSLQTLKMRVRRTRRRSMIYAGETKFTYDRSVSNLFVSLYTSVILLLFFHYLLYRLEIDLSKKRRSEISILILCKSETGKTLKSSRHALIPYCEICYAQVENNDEDYLAGNAGNPFVTWIYSIISCLLLYEWFDGEIVFAFYTSI